MVRISRRFRSATIEDRKTSPSHSSFSRLLEVWRLSPRNESLPAESGELEGADTTQVLGVSMDSPFSNFAFAQQNGIGFPMLSDWGGPVTRRYGLTEKFEIEGVPMEPARRATFLIDKSGTIIHEQVGHAAVDPSKTVEACERHKLKH